MKLKNIVIMLILLSTFVSAQWDDCPFGEVDEPYPGTCGRYIDTNDDGLCDHSQEDPSITGDAVETVIETQVSEHDMITGQELKTKSVEEVAALYQISSHEYAYALMELYPDANIHCTTSFQYLHDNYGLEPSVAKNVAAEMSPIVFEEIEPENTIVNSVRYPMVPILIILFIVYIISYVLSDKKILKLKFHVKLWNYLLLFTFLVSGILGILLVLRINYGWFTNFPFNMLYWHVEFGIAMSILTIFHIFWYMPYFRKMIRKMKKKNKK